MISTVTIPLILKERTMSETFESFLGLLIFLAIIGVIYYVVQKNKKKKEGFNNIPVVKPVPRPTPTPAPTPAPTPTPVPTPPPSHQSTSLEGKYGSLIDLLEFVERTNYGGRITVDGDEVNPGYGPTAVYLTQQDGSVSR